MVDHVYTYDASKLSFNDVVQSLSTIRGHVVEMPLQYLSQEKLINSALTKLTGKYLLWHAILIRSEYLYLSLLSDNTSLSWKAYLYLEPAFTE